MPPATPAPARAVVFTLDTLAPSVTISSAAETSNVATQTISGSVTAGEAAVGATVTLLDTVGGVTTQIGTATVGSGGLWTTTVTLSGDGAHSIVAQDTDAAGNTGTSTAVVFTLDTLAPSVTISSAAETSNVATQTISGSVTAGEAAVGATVTLLDTVGGVTTQIGTATVGSGGLWTTTVTLSGDGAHSIVAQDTDAAGNTGTSTAVVFTLDTAAHWIGNPGNDWTTANDWSDGNGNIIPTPNSYNDAVIDESGAYTLTITSAATANTLTIAPAGAGADVQDETGGSLTLNGALTIDAGSFSLIGGTLTTSSVYVGSSGHFIGKGDVQAPINNAGTVEALGESIVAGRYHRRGSFTIDSGNTLEFGKSVAAGATVSFADPAGTLQLDNSTGAVGSSFGATINNFGGSDVIDLTDLAYASSGETFTWNSANNALTVSNGTQSTTITLAASYTIGNFALASIPALTRPPAIPEQKYCGFQPVQRSIYGTARATGSPTPPPTGAPVRRQTPAIKRRSQAVRCRSIPTLRWMSNAIQNNAQINVGVTAAAVLTLDATTMTGGTLLINTNSSATFDDASVSATAITVGNAQPFSVLSGPSRGN